LQVSWLVNERVIIDMKIVVNCVIIPASYMIKYVSVVVIVVVVVVSVISAHDIDACLRDFHNVIRL